MAERRAAAVDRAVRRLFAPFEDQELSLVATGGYGRSELAPGSDIDVLILHPAGSPEDAARAAEAVLYPLWDAGWRVGHAVRTPEQCAEEGRQAMASLTALLDGRLVAGSAALFDQARVQTIAVMRGDRAGFVGRLVEDRERRRERFGTVGHSLEPDLKEGLGGIRDWHLLGWLTVVQRRRSPSDPHVRAAADLLLLARTALHRVAGGGSNRLSADRQGDVAGELGITGAEGWEPRDELMRQVYRHARRLDLAATDALGTIGQRRPAAPAARRSRPVRGAAGLRDLLHVLTAGDLPTLERMEADGDVAALIDGWVDVAGRPQRDPYHRYPVDTHLLATASEVAKILSEPGEPFLATAVEAVDAPQALLLGALLHDIGKVGRGSHVRLGTAMAEGALDGLEADPRLQDEVLFLVREHLLLSDTATRRDIDDEDLVVQVAARVGDQRRLAMLFVLTVADAVATGPSASSPWRMGLLRELVARVSRVFEKGLMDPDRAGRLAEATEAVRAALSGLPPDRADLFLSSIPSDYLLWVRPEEAGAHAALVLPPPAPAEVRTEIRPGRSKETYRVAVAASDRLGLLASIAGALALSGLSILRAQAFTTSQGVALDLFEVRGAFEPNIDDERWGRFRDALTDSLSGAIDLLGRVEARRSQYPPPASDVPVSVRVDQEASDFYTVVEVSAPDRMGLLFDLARAFAAGSVDVHLAKVATYGPRVVDAFYVTEQAGRKLEGARLGELMSGLDVAARADIGRRPTADP